MGKIMEGYTVTSSERLHLFIAREFALRFLGPTYVFHPNCHVKKIPQSPATLGKRAYA